MVYPGADVPLSTWLEAVRLRRPRAAVTAASMRRDAISAGRVADMLAAHGMRDVWTGGAHGEVSR